VTLTNTGVTKVYDGTANAPAGFTPTGTASNLVVGDTAVGFNTTTFSAAYNSAHVSTVCLRTSARLPA